MRYFPSLRSGFLALALSLALLAAPLASFAQGLSEDDLEGLLGGATRSYELEDFDFESDTSEPIGLFFAVMEFDSEANAENAAEMLIDMLVEELSGDMAMDDEVDVEFEVEDLGEYDIADGASATRLSYEDEFSALIFDFLTIRDGMFVHLYFSAVFSFSFDFETDMNGDRDTEGTPDMDTDVETDEDMTGMGMMTTEPIDLLVPIAEAHFADGGPSGEMRLDLLPGDDLIPEGYVLESEEEGLTEFFGEGDDFDDFDDFEDESTPAA